MVSTFKRIREIAHHPLSWILLLELLIYLVPFLFGYPLIYGDNLNQNLPLRALSGNIFAAGHLPSWDLFNWAGEPLLAGFNAGVFFPLTWLFIVFSAPLAMSLNLALTFFIASSGVYMIVRHLGGSKFASSAAALAFTFSGQFASQSVHIDMIEGIASSVWMLYFVFKLFKASSTKGRLGNAVLFGTSFAFTVLAGAPEAMIDGLIMAGTVSLVLFLKAPKKLQMLALLALAGIIALSLSAIQWIPGLLFETLSNRAKNSANFFEAGPYSPYYLPTFINPFLLGNYSAFGVTGYFSSYNLAEISTYLPPVVSVVGVASLLSKRLTPISSSIRIALLAAGTVALILALGTYLPPFEYIMAHVPLYNLQRLPSRNMFVVDLVLTLGFGSSLDKISQRIRSKLPFQKEHFTVLTWVSIVFGVLAVTTTTLLIVSQTSLFQLLNVPSPYPTHLFSLKVMVSVETLLTLVSLSSLVFSIHTKKSYKALLVKLSIVVGALQLLTFGVQTLYGQIPSNGPYADTADFTRYTPKLPANERSVIFDPYLFYYSSLLNVGLPDLNYLVGQLSAQGYASLGIENFNQVTNSKLEGSFNPYVIDSFGVNYLNVSRVISGSKYFLTREPAPLNPTNGQPPVTYAKQKVHVAIGSKKVTANSSIYLGSPTKVTYIGVKVPNSIHLSCVTSASVTGPLGTSPLIQRSTEGRYVFFETTTAPTLSYEVNLNLCGSFPTLNGSPDAPIVVDSGGSLFKVNGWLAYVVTPKLFSYSPGPNQLSIFSYRKPHKSLVKTPPFASVKSVHQSLDGTITFTSNSPRPYVAVLSQAYTNGWAATYKGAGNDTLRTTNVGDYKALQTIFVPAGNVTITDTYSPPGLITGGTLSIFGLIGTLLLLWFVRKNLKH